MEQITIIGSIGANAQIQAQNGRQFVSFRVATNNKYTDSQGTTHETTQWYDVTMQGNGGRLFRYLVQGQQVLVQGRPAYRIYDSAKFHCKMVGVSIFATNVELIGSAENFPRKLLDAGGIEFSVNKHYHIPDESAWGQVLHSKNLIEYECDENGFIKPRAAETAPQS